MLIVPPPTWEKDLNSPVWQNWFSQLQLTVGDTGGTSYEARITDLEADKYNKTGGQITGNANVTGTFGVAGAVDFDTTLNVDGAGTFRGVNQFGNIAGGNYAEFEADGTLELLGNATTFRDELVDTSNIQVTGVGISIDSAENTVDILTTAAPASDYAYANVQLNHDRKNGATIHPHVHWFQDQNNTPNFLLQYRWQRNGQAKVTAWTNYPMTTNAYTYVSGTLNQITYGAGITPPAGDNVSDIVQIRFTRDKTNTTGAFGGSDTHTATVKVTSVDVHIETNTLGSRSEYNK